MGRKLVFMPKMTTPQKNEGIKKYAVSAFSDKLTELGAIQVDGFTYAIPVTIEGVQRYAEITFTAKNDQPTTRTEAYDPYAKRDEWTRELDFKANEKAAKDAEKVKKIERDEKKRAKEAEEKKVREDAEKAKAK